jgi:type I restriction enzyme S subunit
MKKGWTYKKLGEVCKIYQPQTIASSLLKEDGKYPVFGANGMIGRYDSYNHEDPEVLLCCRGATCGAINVSLPFSWINGNAMVVKPINDSFLKSFLRYILLTLDYSHIITGAAQPQITRTSLSPVTVPVPTIIEQQSIVAYLDSAFAKIDALKANAEKALGEAKALFQASLKEMLEPKEGWEENTLKEIVHPDCTLSYGIVQPGEHVEDGVPVVRPVDFNDKVIVRVEGLKRTKREISEAYKRTILKGGEILLCVRGTTGTMGLASDELQGCNVTRGIVPIFFDKDVNKMFVYYQLLSPKLQKEIQKKTMGAALKQINIKDLRAIHLMFPPLSEQQSIVATLDSLKSKVDSLQENYEKISKECDALKQAMLREIFE